MKMIKVSTDYSTKPAGRYIGDGPHNGEKFYKTLLKPAVDSIWADSNEHLEVDFNGVYGLPYSFISEVFTRLLNDYPDRDKVYSKITFVTNNKIHLKVINEVIDETAERNAQKASQ